METRPPEEQLEMNDAPAESAGKPISRRGFVPAAGVSLAAFTVLPRHVLGGQGNVAPSDKLNIAGIGLGGMGKNYLLACESENIVALADVDFDLEVGGTSVPKVFARYPKANRYHDYRLLLEKEKGIDAVVIGTPDHTHAVIAMAAMRLGKHVYCAKPLTRTIHECRALAKAARDARVATQMSVQTCASETSCAVEELIQAGAIGDVREVHVWTDRPVWPQGLARPQGAQAAPASLQWDLWLGPAPVRPYHRLYHPFNWRGWYDFGTGALGDMALHTFHNVFRALRLTYPTKVSSSTSVVCVEAAPGEGDPGWPLINRLKFSESFPHASMVTWDFPARGDLPPVRLHWYEGGLKPPPPADLDPNQSLRPEGFYYAGDKGVLLVGSLTDSARPGRGADGGVRSGRGPASGLLPAERFKDFTPPPKTVSRTIGHYQEWIAAAKGGPPPNCNFDFAGIIAETALLGVISQRTGKTLVWDAGQGRITNDADSNQYVNPPYRSGWTL
jgi:predicted dehydrogenase